MFDAGLVDFKEPFLTLRNQGMILAPDGRKMSKSWGNVIAPDELIEQGYGADSIRVMELFIGPWNQQAAWSVEGMGGCFRFLQRVWTLVQEYLEANPTGDKDIPEITVLQHQAIAKVSKGLEDLGFNTAIATLMEYVNGLYKIKAEDSFASQQWSDAITVLVQLLAPFAPHIAEELWSDLGKTESVHISEWPVHQEKYLVSDSVTIVVQVNGKVRANLTLPTGSDQASAEAAARADSKVAGYLSGEVRKVIFVPNKLISFVVS
jgi:leucyl-tRNA synthetase